MCCLTFATAFQDERIVAGTLALALTANIVEPRAALAWGDDGHKVIALIAQSSAGHHCGA
jgi:hypothetical protein